MKRLYDVLIRDHFRDFRQMALLAGPRQVGKTTICLNLAKKGMCYLNWDESEHRQKIIAGSSAVAQAADLFQAHKEKPILIFDEIHKYSRWKQFMKGFFDLYGELCHIGVTGSAKLNIYRRMGDSLMGRYFLYRIHPLSVGELLHPYPQEELIYSPQKLSVENFQRLIEFGGFPEPYLKAAERFASNWRRSRLEQLIREDIRDLSQIKELNQLEMLAAILVDHIGQQVSQTSFANQIQVSVPTVSRWLTTLETFYYCFAIRPWTKNVRRSLRKEPKYYLWDWALVSDEAARLENMVASHLLKAVHFWTDYGLGDFQLYYLRDKEKREVDFLVTKNKAPWFLVEVKMGNHSGISSSLYHFQQQTEAPHAFQVSFGLDYVDKDCFAYKQPVIVSAKTFLSQLV